VGKTLDVLGQAVGMERLDGVHDSCVELASSLLQQAAVRHLVCQRMFE
jgi:hypothetical protein